MSDCETNPDEQPIEYQPVLVVPHWAPTHVIYLVKTATNPGRADSLWVTRPPPPPVWPNPRRDFLWVPPPPSPPPRGSPNCHPLWINVNGGLLQLVPWRRQQNIRDDTENPTFHPMMPANINEGHNEYYPPPDPHHQFGMQQPMQMHRNNESWYTNPIDGSNMRLFYPPDDFQGAPVHQPMQGRAPFYQQMPGEPVYQHMPGEPFYQPLQGGEPFYQQMQGAPFYQQIPGEPVLQQIMPEAPVHQQTIRKTPDTNIHEGELQFFDFTGLDSEETARIQNILHNPDPAVQMPPENNENDESRGLRELYNSRRDETIRRNSTPVRPDTNPQEGDELQFLDLTGLDSEETARIQNILHNPDLSVQMPPENNENEHSSNISRPANSTSQLRQTPQARKQAKRKPMKKRR